MRLIELFEVFGRFEAEISNAIDGRLRSELDLPLSAFLLLSALSGHGPSRVNDVTKSLGLTVGVIVNDQYSSHKSPAAQVVADAIIVPLQVVNSLASFRSHPFGR